MHLTEAELAALTHGDVSAPSSEALTHLASCPECTARLEVLRAADREVAGLLRGVDHAAPRVRGTAFVDALHARRRRIGAIAAGLAFCVAGAAAALPNSPLHQVLLRVVFRTESQTAIADRPRGPVRPKPGAGVAFIPGSSLEVLFRNPRSGGHLRVSLVDGPQVSAIADGDAAFSIHQSQLEVNDHGVAMSFALEIPRSVPEVTIRTGSETILVKHAGVMSRSPVKDSTGAYTFEF
jgi:F0F1-type ATP synthase membrane subunit c/vacuolar-type H+-ATPase subunit K